MEEELDPSVEDVDNLEGNLISFANLENVVKHIIRKFKAIESHNHSTDGQIDNLKKDLDQRATIVMVDDGINETNSKIESVQKAVTGQKDILSTIESQLERNRVTCSAIDKKLEACVKEKAVQDRLIRETQDALQDKVAVAELNMFEAKFAGYATKLEHQEVISMLSHYTRAEATERIAESVKVLGTQFDDYTRTARIEQQLQELRDWVCSELQHYAKAAKTTERIEELQTQIKEQALAFERVNSLMDDKLRGLSDRVTSIYTELTNDVHKRALAADLETTQKELKKYALKNETDAFQQDCIPKLRFCVESIQAFNQRLKARDDAILRVDEVLLDKAGKYDIVVANSRIEQCMQKDSAMKEFETLTQYLENLSIKLQQYIAAEQERMAQLRPPDYTPVFKDINSRIALKADKADLVEMYQLKANRIDSDELAKLQDTIHKQLEYLAVTNFGLSKLVLTEAKTAESKLIRTQQKSQVLMQSEALWHWILHNEPPPNLDTLRPPASKGSKNGEGQNSSGREASATAAADKDKRAMDQMKSNQLEKKLGISAS